MPLDILGKCPCCGYNWDGGLIIDKMSTLKVFNHSENDLAINTANTAFGANNINKVKFSLVKVVNFVYDNIILYTCPNIMCGKTFDKDGNKFNIVEFKRKKYEKYKKECGNTESIKLVNYNKHNSI